eukprot:symbB.v1.2.003514.t1/scaffold201.1/size272743/6
MLHFPSIKQEKKPEVVAPRVIEVVQPAKTEDLEIWKEKCANLEDEKVDLENQISDLNQQVRILTEKLQEVGGEQALLEVQEKIKLTVKPRQKKKKKRAYERLWQDAQRRIINMRVQAKVLEKEQQDQIVAWRKNAVTNSNSMKIIESLSRMHYDASSSQTALNQAMEDYSIENQDGDMHDVWDDEEDEADDTPLSHPGTSAKYNFSGIVSIDMFYGQRARGDRRRLQAMRCCCCWPRLNDETSDDSSAEESQDFQVEYDSLYFPPQPVQGRTVVVQTGTQPPAAVPLPLLNPITSLKSLSGTPTTGTPMPNVKSP